MTPRIPLSSRRGWLHRLVVLCGIAGALAQAGPANPSQPPGPSVARLVASQATVAPGEAFELGLLIRLAPGWHTYGDPPGDSGMPPSVTITGAAGLVIGPLRLPPPARFADAAGETLGYERAVLLRWTARAPAGASATSPAGTLAVGARADWLVCGAICVPQSADLSLILPLLPAGSPGHPNPDWPRFLEEGQWTTNPPRPAQGPEQQKKETQP